MNADWLTSITAILLSLAGVVATYRDSAAQSCPEVDRSLKSRLLRFVNGSHVSEMDGTRHLEQPSCDLLHHGLRRP